MTIYTIISILAITAGIIMIAVAIDVLPEYIGEKKKEREARKEERAEFDEWALRMLTIAGRRMNAHAIYRREQGMHRHVRV